VNGVRSKSAKSKIALFQPLTLLDLVVYYKENANIKRIKEIRCQHQYQSLQTDVRKSSLGMFINEVLNKSVKEENHAQELFEFLFDSLIFLDQQKVGYENFHLIFLIKLSRLLGFGAHQAEEVLTGRLVEKQEELLLKKLIEAEYQDAFIISNAQRRSLLEILLRFYSAHIDSLGEIRSVQVLKDLAG